MSRSGYRKLVLGCLIAALSTWYGLSRIVGDTGPASALAATEESSGADESLDDLSLDIAPVPRIRPRAGRESAQVEWPADPFFRRAPTAVEEDPGDGVEARAQEPRFVLRAIIEGVRPLALIDGVVVAVGDRLVDGSTVVAIRAYSVTLQGPQGTWILRLSQ